MIKFTVYMNSKETLAYVIKFYKIHKCHPGIPIPRPTISTVWMWYCIGAGSSIHAKYTTDKTHISQGISRT